MTAGLRKAAIVAVVALAYTACGIVGMSLAIPPAQATPLFPAAGLAVAAVLRHGGAAVAGVWIGQAAMQVVRHGLAEGLPTPFLLACWGMLSVGAALQAAVAVALVHAREPRGASGARRTRRLFGLLFLSGMIACTVSATVGIGTLTAAGFVTSGDALRSWWEWYSGDTLGVFIFAPFIVMLLERERREWSDAVLQVLLRWGRITALLLCVVV
ncbi:MAG: MASE1 domain-containing protein, partial [Planctomycetia bacterium]